MPGWKEDPDTASSNAKDSASRDRYEAQLLAKSERPSHQTSVILQFHKADVPDASSKRFFDLWQMVLQTATTESSADGSCLKRNITLPTDVIELGFLTKKENYPDRPMRIPMAGVTMSFCENKGQFPHIKFDIEAPEKPLPEMENWSGFKRKNKTYDPFKSVRHMHINFGYGSLEKTQIVKMTTEIAATEKIPVMMTSDPNFQEHLAKGHIRKMEVYFRGLSDDCVAPLGRAMWSQNLFTETYLPATDACLTEWNLLKSFLTRDSSHFTVWIKETDNFNTWYSEFIDHIDTQGRNGHPYLAYYEQGLGLSQLVSTPRVHYNQKYLRDAPIVNRPTFELPYYKSFPDLLSLTTTMGMSTIMEYKHQLSNTSKINNTLVGCRFVEDPDSMPLENGQYAAYYAFTSTVGNEIISTLREGDSVGLNFDSAVDHQWTGIIINPSFVPFQQKAIHVFRPFKSTDKTSKEWNQYSKKTIIAMPAEEYLSLSLEEFASQLRQLPKEYITFCLRDEEKSTKRVVNAVSRVLNNDANHHTLLQKTLIGQNMTTMAHINLFRTFENQPMPDDFAQYGRTAYQRSIVKYLKKIPNNIGIIVGGPGCSKTDLIKKFIIWPLVTTDRFYNHETIDPGRTYHQVVYCSESNAICEGILPGLAKMIKDAGKAADDVLIIRVYSMHTEKALWENHNRDKRWVDPNRAVRPSRFRDGKLSEPLNLFESPSNLEFLPTSEFSSTTLPTAIDPNTLAHIEESTQPLPVSGGSKWGIGRFLSILSSGIAELMGQTTDHVTGNSDNASQTITSVSGDNSTMPITTLPTFPTPLDDTIMSDLAKDMVEAIHNVQKDVAVPGIFDARLKYPEYSLSKAMLQVAGIIPRSPAIDKRAYSTSKYATLRELWEKREAEGLDKNESTSLKEQIKQLREDTLKLASVIVTSINNLADQFGHIRPDVCIMAENTMSTEASSYIPLAVFPPHLWSDEQHNWVPATTIIIDGDPQQISPLVLSTKVTNPLRAQQKYPLIGRLLDNGHKSFSTYEVFRSSAGTLDFLNDFYYQGRLKYHSSVEGRLESTLFVEMVIAKQQESVRYYQRLYDESKEQILRKTIRVMANASYNLSQEKVKVPIAVCHVNNSNGRTVGTSKSNTDMISPTMECIKLLGYLGGVRRSIGVISFYKAMTTELISAYRVFRLQNQEVYDVEFSTVDGFQGRDKDFIIINSPSTDGLGFVSDKGRLCTALSRHTYGSILILDDIAVTRLNKRRRFGIGEYNESLKKMNRYFHLHNLPNYAVEGLKLPIDEELEAALERARAVEEAEAEAPFAAQW